MISMMITESNRRAVCIITSMECVDWFCISEFQTLNSGETNIESTEAVPDKRKVTCAIRIYMDRAIIHFR